MRILIIKLSSLGDILQSLPVLASIKKLDRMIDWVVEERCRELVDKHPSVRRTFAINTKRPRQVWKFIKNLRSNHYDEVYDLQGNCKSAIFTLLARGTKKVGYSFKTAPEWPNALVTNHRIDVIKSLPMVDQYFQLIGEEPRSRPVLFRGEVVKWSKSPSWMICIGSNWENKRLDFDQWVEFLSRVDGELILVWKSNQEKSLARRLESALGERASLLGNVTLTEWQRWMDKMSGVITTDSCALHLASLAGVPTLSIFGPSNGSTYAPQREKHAFVQGPCPYGVSFDIRCPKLRTCETGACIKGLSVETLVSAFEGWRSSLHIASKSR